VERRQGDSYWRRKTSVRPLPPLDHSATRPTTALVSVLDPGYVRLAVEAGTIGRSPAPKLLAAAGLGAAVALTLGIYGHVHDPSQKLVFTLFFSSTIAMKVWLASVALAFAVVQVVTALWVYGQLPWTPPPWAGSVHRLSGRLLFLASLPVAYHCLWSLGFQDTNTRVLAHSLIGCAVYGAFAAKVTIVRSKGLPNLALPVAGGAMFALLVLAWYTSALWFIDHNGFPDL
jgi:hypothetical protein